MAGAYDDRDGKIWMDGALLDWRDANVHVLTHALHYASSVFEGERCYSGKIFKGHEHSLRLIESARLLDMQSPYSADEIDAAKQAVLDANGFKDAYVRAVMWRGSGLDMGFRRPATRCAWPSRPGNGAAITAMPNGRARNWTSRNGSGPAPRPFRPQPRPPGFI